MTPRRIAKFLAATGLIALVVIVGAATLIVHNRQREQRVLERSVKLVPGSLLHAHDFHWIQMKHDQEQWELQAKEANYSNSRTSARLKEALLTMTLADGKPLKLRAAQVMLKLQGNHVLQADFSGGLTLDYGDMHLVTEQATFFPDQDKLQAPGFVQIQGAGFKVSGIGLEAHPRAQTFSLAQQVDTELTAERHGVAKSS